MHQNEKNTDESLIDQFKSSKNIDYPLVEKGMMSNWLFLYLNKIFLSLTPITLNQLYKTDANLDHKENTEKFISLVEKALSNTAVKQPTYLSMIYTHVWSVYIKGAIMMGLGFLIQIPLPLLVKYFLAWLTTGAELSEGLYYAAGIAFIGFAKPTLIHQASYYTNSAQLMAEVATRVQISFLIYRDY